MFVPPYEEREQNISNDLAVLKGFSCRPKNYSYILVKLILSVLGIHCIQEKNEGKYLYDYLSKDTKIFFNKTLHLFLIIICYKSDI